MLSFRLKHPTSQEAAEGSPKFLTLLSLHAMLSDPGSPSEISPYRLHCAGFRFVNTVADCLAALTGLNCFGEVRLPYGLQCSLCTLHNCCSSHLLDSFNCATLSTGCRLGFARQGLAPCKKRQAALGALTMTFSRRVTDLKLKKKAVIPGRLESRVRRSLFCLNCFCHSIFSRQ